MSKLRIYGIAKSRAFRTLWMAKEAGIDYEQVPVGFDEQGTRSAWFAAINPNKAIPAIQDGELTLWESLAINLYLAKRYGAALYPRTVEDEARVWQWTLWAATEVEPHVIQVLYHRFMLPSEQRSPAAAEEAITRLAAPLAVLDGALAADPYLVGRQFTVADLNLAGVLYVAYANKFAVPDRANVMAWLERCFERPAAKEARKLREAA